MRSPRLLVLPALLLLACVSGAAQASAATFCVDISPCSGGTGKATIQQALDAAAENTNPGTTDLVLIGDNAGDPFVENLSYTDPEPVEIVGEGRGVTEIETNNAPTLFTMLSPSSVVRSLTLYVPEVSNGTALRWNGTARDIQVIHEGGPAAEILGMRAEDSARLEDSVISGQGVQLFETSEATSVRIVDSTFVGGTGAIRSGTEGTLTIEGSTIAAKRSAIQVGGSMEVFVINSVLRSTASAPSVDATFDVLSGVGRLNQVTVYGKGFGTGLRLNSSSTDSTLSALNSIVEGFQFGLVCSEEANDAALGFRFSNRTDPDNIAAGCDTTLTGMTAFEPSFVNPSALIPQLALKAPSPLIDAGLAGSVPPTDLLGLTRPVDGDGDGVAEADLGAFEYQRRPPVPKLSVTQNPAFPSQFHFSADGSTDPDPGDVLSYSWDFGFRTVTGEEVDELIPPGPHKVTLTVTDSAGASATATAEAFSPYIHREPNEPPSLSKVRAVPKRIVIGKALPKLRPGNKKGIRFTIGGTSQVTLFLNRCKRKPGCTDLAKVPGSATFTATPGAHTISFAGRFKGKKPLAPGRYVARLRLAGGDVYSTRIDLVAPRN